MTPVSIVGAGPGDPSLISVRGLRCLASADVVVHDALIHPRLLRMARPDAECIEVGNAAPDEPAQNAICLLLAEKAREGKSVVRLKWGDPFVFDSGGKEALFLHEQGIGFEVVPGVPALVGIPAYAGIPVTYPGSGNTLTFIRGYEDGDQKAPELDWSQLARVDGTLVCYAGPRQLARVASQLLLHGRPADDSAAVVYDGTTPRQRTTAGTLGELARQFEAQPPQAPAVLVVGPSCGLREHLRWFDERPLFGTRIVVTRSREQAGEFVDRLVDLGADVIQAPSIRIEPLDDYTEIDAAIADISRYHWLVFTSANGVDHFMRRALSRVRDIRDLHGPRLCAVGPATAERLQRLHLRVDVTPEEDRAEGVIAALKVTGHLDGLRMLLPRADIAREILPDELRRAGAHVDDIAAYRTVRATWGQEGQPDIYKQLLEGDVDIVTFTSASSVRHFVTNLGEDQAADLLRQVAVASIGPVTAEAAQQLGVATSIMPGAPYTIASLADAIVAHVRARR
ncbi:MAG: uroporphyrinogen-III C-methyltransferase [Acidobacteria bacterium]|nr:uroporphyrinogen-III C-methyltransferase [Acidobacteriota bacterium]